MINYLDFWKLSRAPFDAVVDPEFFFESQAHGEALARLLYFAGDRTMGLAALTGEIGSGKTLTLQVLLSRLRPDLYRTVVLYTADGRIERLLGEINAALRGVAPESGAAPDFHAARLEFRRLLREHLAARGRHLLVVLDEAQFLAPETLDALKCLTNPDESGPPPVSLLFVGQPELKENLRRLPQVYQRLGLMYHLGHLRREELAAYLRHRMSVAGAADPDVFDADGLDPLFAFSGGCPRQINRICKLAVDRACLLQQHRVDAEMLRLIMADFERQFA